MICDSIKGSSDSPNGVKIDIESTFCWTLFWESPGLPFGFQCIYKLSNVIGLQFDKLSFLTPGQGGVGGSWGFVFQNMTGVGS